MNQSDCSYNLLRSYVSLDFTRLPMKLQSLQLEKTRILQTLISFFFNLVISLSIVNDLSNVHSQLHGLYKSDCRKVQDTKL